MRAVKWKIYAIYKTTEAVSYVPSWSEGGDATAHLCQHAAQTRIGWSGARGAAMTFLGMLSLFTAGGARAMNAFWHVLETPRRWLAL